MSTSTSIGHGLAKVLGIKLNERQAPDPTTRGESTYSVESADSYIEEEPRTIDWILDVLPSNQTYVHYVRNLFPFTKWILRYNLLWLAGDLVAGITVGAVVVPQGMAYAKLAELPVQFGLYSSFMGVLIYWFFATSKDITIGPVAVMSTVTGNIVLKAATLEPTIPGHVVASCLAIITGGIICFIGLIRCGWIVDFIPLTAISAFMTGSALNICVGQVPNLLGIKVKTFNTRASTYLVVINTLKYLHLSKLDAAIGMTALFLLYAIRSGCKFAAKRFPNKSKLIFFLSTLRTVFVILLYTMISWLANRHHKKPIFQILGTVPRGFQDAAVPTVNKTIIKTFASQLPAAVIVMLIEHIAIAKSFGRVNNYTIDPSQEMVAIGISNLLGPFLGAYPATGSFSRTAIKSKAGVRTPLAGVITAIVVLLAIYALPAVFYWIPNALLAAVIIHAVGDLITPPNTVYQFWRVSPLEVIVFFAGVFVTIFTSIENGIYTTICVSLAIYLFRVVKANGSFLGKVKVHSVIGDHLLEAEEKFPGYGAGSDDAKHKKLDEEVQVRNVFLPIDHHDGSNPSIAVESPYPGIFIYRFSEGLNYPNANHYTDYLVATVFQQTRRSLHAPTPRLGDRPWNNPGPRRGHAEPDRGHLPTLKAIILDFSSVNNVDVTSIQNLIDVRNQLDRYSAPDVVQWHIACINNRWTKRALASAGFGYPTYPTEEFHRLKPIFSVAEIGGSSSAAQAAETRENRKISLTRPRSHDIEEYPRSGLGSAGKQPVDDTIVRHDHEDGESSGSSADAASVQKQISTAYARRLAAKHVAVTHGLNRPFFHVDLTNALQSAITNVESREEIARISESAAAADQAPPAVVAPVEGN